MLSINLPPGIETRLNDVALKGGRRVEDYVREAIVEKVEDDEDRLLAEERVRSDCGRRIPLTEVMTEFAGDLRQSE